MDLTEVSLYWDQLPRRSIFCPHRGAVKLVSVGSVGPWSALVLELGPLVVGEIQNERTFRCRKIATRVL